MSTKKHTFPWGIYIGDLIDNNDTIPLCLNSKQGGFCLLFDEESEAVANNFIENVALKLFEVMPLGDIQVNVFDFGDIRFSSLTAFERHKLYDIAYEPKSSKDKFEALHKLSRDRIHGLLDGYESLSAYNKDADFIERYHLLLINIEDFVHETGNTREIKRFFETAFKAGFYTILFGDMAVKESKSETMQSLLSYFPKLSIEKQKFHLTKELFEFADMLEEYEFNSVNDNKEQIVQTLVAQYKAEEANSSEADFLSVPIGKSLNQRETLYFSLGKRSKNYHAFIAGSTGSGKSNLINLIILGIAQKYKATEMELYLIDYKGVDFKKYKNHPNCRKLLLNKDDIDASVSILEEFNHELKVRKKKFEIDDRIDDINMYNSLNPNAPLSYKILLIDEVQNLFSDKTSKELNRFHSLLDEVLREGRAFGLSIILATQHLKDVNMSSSLMESLTLRVTLDISESVASKILDASNTSVVNELGDFKFVYNHRAGKRNSNLIGRTLELDKFKIIEILSDITESRKRNQELVLVPEIVKSIKVEEENEVEEVARDSAFSVRDSEQELLAKLARDGVKPRGMEGVK